MSVYAKALNSFQKREDVDSRIREDLLLHGAKILANARRNGLSAFAKAFTDALRRARIFADLLSFASSRMRSQFLMLSRIHEDIRECAHVTF